MTRTNENPERVRRRPGRPGTGLAFALAGLALLCAGAQAQSMDYGSLEQLFGEPVTTSATGSPERTTEAPANMIIVTADEIRRSGARDIPGVLRHVAGVDVVQWARDHADVSIRGYDEPFAARTLVLIDGRQVYADYYGFIPWGTLPVELAAIRQIEIVKGPNAALFGFNAVGGVINIITCSPRFDSVNNLSAQVGTQGLAALSGVATIKLGEAGALRLSGRLMSDKEFNTPIPAGMAGPPRTANGSAAADAVATFALASNVELGLEASHSRLRENDLTPGYIYEDSRFETDSVLARIAADTNIGLLKFTAYTNRISQRTAFVLPLGSIAFKNQTTVAQAEDVFGLGTDHTLRIAVEYRHNSVNTSTFVGGRILYSVVSVSSIWQWRISPSISLTNALRLDHLTLGRSGLTPADYPLSNQDWDRTFDELSFNSGLVWRVVDDDSLRFTVGRGVQLPSLTKAGALLFNSPYIKLTGVPTIRPTTVTNYEITWHHQLHLLSAQLRASVFHQNSNNLSSTSGGIIPIPGGIYLTSSNIGDSRADGFELNLRGDAGDDWRWSLSYRAEFISDDFLPSSADGMNFVDYQHTTPKHLAKAQLGWTLGKWEADAFVAYQSNTMGLRPISTGGTVLVPVGAYASMDGRIAYHLTDWATIALSGQNLLQSPQRQTSGPLVERQVFATLRLGY